VALAVVALLVGIALALLQPASGRALDGCDLYAAPGGSDDASGTAAAPLRSAQQLADSLAPSQVGCFMAGTYAFDGQIKVSRADITLTSAPGARATIVGRWWIAAGADNVTVSRLDLDGRNPAGQAGPTVNAANTVFSEDDVTNHHAKAICFVLGSADYGVAVGTVIENSRIHDCGELPATNQEHGIYVEDSEGVVIRDNWIYDNADRGVQLYPNAVGTHVYGNVIDGNGEGLTFSGEGPEASRNNVVEGNVISNSSVRWNVEAHWTGVVGTGNVLRNNCLWSSNGETYYNQGGGVVPADEGGEGFVSQGNVIANPGFVDRANANFELQSDSPCGPAQGGESTVTLKAPRRVVYANAPVVLVGTAATDSTASGSGRAVTIMKWQNGHWRRFARRRVRRDGSFRVRKRLHGRRSMRFRAVVWGLGASRPVRIGLRSSSSRLRLGQARPVG
jgi:parallel beta-helix repeat protein